MFSRNDVLKKTAFISEGEHAEFLLAIIRKSAYEDTSYEFVTNEFNGMHCGVMW